MIEEDKRGTRNKRETRGKVAGRKLGIAKLKEHIYDMIKNVEREEWRMRTAERKGGRWSVGNEVEVKPKIESFKVRLNEELNERIGEVLYYVREREGLGKSWKHRNLENRKLENVRKIGSIGNVWEIWNWKIAGNLNVWEMWENLKLKNIRKKNRWKMWNKIGKCNENWSDERW